jgi:hypothetical protein
MHPEPPRHDHDAFHGLTPPLILDLAEAALGVNWPIGTAGAW